MRSVLVVGLLVSLFLAACVAPARPGRLAPSVAAQQTVQPLDGVYDVAFHSTWFGPLRTTMTAQAIPATAKTATSFKANTRPGIAWELVGGVQKLIGPVVAPYIFPNGMLLTWQSTMPAADGKTPGEGWIGIAPIGPFGAKTRMIGPQGPVEIVFTDGRVIAVMSLTRREDQTQTVPPLADYTRLTTDIRQMTSERLFDQSIPRGKEFDEYFTQVAEASAKVKDDLEFTFAGGLAWRKHQNLPLPFAYRPATDESKALMKPVTKGVEPLTFKIDEKTGIATIEAIAFENAQAVDQVFAKLLASNAKGLILDLRSCTGFDLAALRAACWMLAAPADGGRFVNAAHRATPADSATERVRIESASSVAAAHEALGVNGKISLTVVPEANAYRGPIAVLTLGRTRSSGEVLAAMLKGRSETRFFGAKTASRPRLTFERELPQGYVVRIPEYDWIAPGAELAKVGVCEVKPDVRCSKDQAPVKAAEWLKTLGGGEARTVSSLE